jgi:hypothetical protein
MLRHRMSNVRRPRILVPVLEPLEARDVPTGLGILPLSSQSLPALLPATPVPVLPSVQDVASAIVVQPVRNGGLAATTGNLLGVSTLLQGISLDTSLPVASTVTSLLRLATQPDLTARHATIPVLVQTLPETLGKLLSPVVATVSAVTSLQDVRTSVGISVEEQTQPNPAEHGSPPPADNGTGEAQTPPTPAEPQALPPVGNGTAALSPRVVAERFSAVAAALPTPSGPTPQQPLPSMPAVPAATTGQGPSGATSTITTNDESFLSGWPAFSFLQTAITATHDQVAESAIAGSEMTSADNRWLALTAGVTEQDTTEATEDFLLEVDTPEGSGLLCAFLPASGGDLTDSWPTLGSLSGSDLSLWVLSLPLSAVAFVAIDLLRRRSQEEPSSHHLAPGWGLTAFS